MKQRIDVSLQQVIVDCPAWLQRKMLDNLGRATKDRVNLCRTKRAQDLLDAIKSGGAHTKSTLSECKLLSTITTVSNQHRTDLMIQRANRGLWRHPKAAFYKVVRRIS